MKLGPLEIVLILVVILVIFGVGKLPQVGSALGKSIRAFKEGQSGGEEEEDEEEEEAKKPRRRQTKKAATRKAKTVASQVADEEKTTAPAIPTVPIDSKSDITF